MGKITHTHTRRLELIILKVLKSESGLVKNENLTNFSSSPLLPLIFLTLSKLYSEQFADSCFTLTYHALEPFSSQVVYQKNNDKFKTIRIFSFLPDILWQVL